MALHLAETQTSGSASSTSNQTGQGGDYGDTWVASSGGAPSSVGTGATPHNAFMSFSSPSFMAGIAGKDPDDAQSNDFYQGWAVNYYRNQNKAPYKLHPTKYQDLAVPRSGIGFATIQWSGYGGMAINGEWGGGGGGVARLGGSESRYAVAGTGGQGFVVAVIFADI